MAEVAQKTVTEKQPAKRFADNDAKGDIYAFPEGWFQIAYSDEVAAGQVLKLHYFGQEMVLFRTESGKAQVIDAYCAHLGAHLGVGGVVEGENIRCPFHAWEYGTDGLCKKIPYSDRIPPRGALVKTWPTEERSGLVLIWHSPIGNAPLWDPPELVEYGDPAWEGYLRQSWVVHTTVREIAENVVDTAHGIYVHGGLEGPAPPRTEFSFDGRKMLAHFIKYNPSVGATNDHHTTVYGLGLSINRSKGKGQKAFWGSYTPVDRNTVQARFSMLAKINTDDDPTGENSRYSARGTLLEFAKDIPIWENKIYKERPLVNPHDGPIAAYRKWTQQFYPE